MPYLFSPRRSAGRALAILAASIMLLGASQAPAAAIDPAEAVARVQAYLDDLTTLRARFVQIGPRGELSRGQLYLRRPGRLRFDYDPPSPILVLADGVWLILYDKELRQTSRWPLADTPLGLLVDTDVRLAERVTVKTAIREPGVLKLTLIDRRRPDEGEITLVFAAPRLQLMQWQVLDAQGGRTTINLSEISEGETIDPKLFFFDEPDPFENRDPDR